jgi:hypothetical protein
MGKYIVFILPFFTFPLVLSLDMYMFCYRGGHFKTDTKNGIRFFYSILLYVLFLSSLMLSLQSYCFMSEVKFSSFFSTKGIEIHTKIYFKFLFIKTSNFLKIVIVNITF